MADDIKEETKVEPQTQEPAEQLPEAIKVGEKAYTQEELQRLVGLGETASELEGKWNTKIDRLMPEYTKSRQQLSEYEKMLEERKAQEVQTKQQEGQQLSQEELRAQAVRELGGLMRDPEVQKVVKEVVNEQTQAGKLIDDTEFVIEDYAEQGLPKTTVEDLLQHMADTGIKNPDKAYKDMFEEEYSTWQQERLSSLKQPGMVTVEGSTAGGKTPPQVNIPKNTEELKKTLRDFIANSGQ